MFADQTSAAAASTCQYCGAFHPGVVCGRIVAIEFHADGVTWRRVELQPMAPANPVPVAETDESLRARVRAAAGVGTIHDKKISEATGRDLEAVGALYGVVRFAN